MQKITFNMNNYVLVKLTPFGKEKLKQDYYLLFEYAGIPKKDINKFVLPEEDENGYSKWQLHRLMERLGKYCQLGYEPPFETDIIFIKDICND